MSVKVIWSGDVKGEAIYAFLLSVKEEWAVVLLVMIKIVDWSPFEFNHEFFYFFHRCEMIY